MNQEFAIDENELDTTNSYLNSDASFSVSPLQKENEETSDSIDERNITTTSSYLNSPDSLIIYTSHFNNNYEEPTEIENKTTPESQRLNTGNFHKSCPSPVIHNPKKDNEISFIKKLFQNFNKHCVPIANIIIGILREFKSSEQSLLIKKLTGHVGIYEGGYPWIDLEACWILNLHNVVKNEHVELPTEPPLPNKIKFALAEGRHVPIQHIILGLHLAQFNKDLKEYPYEFTDKIDVNFVQKINRSDVLRAINVHSLFLGFNFPQIAVQFCTIKEYLWQYMFKEKHSAFAGMELYNEIFFNFTCYLGKGFLMPLRHIPIDIVEKINNNYKDGN